MNKTSNKVLLSICIPTFNRTDCLKNCLNSILIAKKNYNFNFEVCVSDNCSTIKIESIINKYQRYYKIRFNKNKSNIGLGANILKAVSLARGQFVWILGNDDLLMPYTFKYIDKLLKKKNKIDFFYVNSYHLDSSFVFKHKQPFNIKNLPKKMNKFSTYPECFETDFLNLVDYNISFDFLLGMFLAIFKKENWDKSLFRINQKSLKNKNTFSTFDNTAPHIIVWSEGFKNSKAYFHAKPLSVNLYGVREWIDLYPFVESIRIPEALYYYRLAGLTSDKYYKNKNYALKSLIINLIKIYFFKNTEGSKYIKVRTHIISNLLYPSIYYGFVYFVIKKILRILKNYFELLR